MSKKKTLEPTRSTEPLASRHSKVVGFFKSVWQHHDLDVKNLAAPRPTDKAKDHSRDEAVEWHASLRGSPLLHSRRFFLVEYGIELLEEEKTKREMHVSLLGYSSFVLIFLLYVFTNVPVANTFSTKRAIHDAVVDSNWVVPTQLTNTPSSNASYSNPNHSVGSTNVKRQTSHDVQQNTLRNVNTREDVWEWLLHGLTNTNMAANTGPFSATKRIAEWNVVMGAVRLRQIRLKNDNCLQGKTVITHQLNAFHSTDCHGVCTLSNIATSKFGTGSAKNYTSAPMVERSEDG